MIRAKSENQNSDSSHSQTNIETESRDLLQRLEESLSKGATMARFDEEWQAKSFQRESIETDEELDEVDDSYNKEKLHCKESDSNLYQSTTKSDEIKMLS